MKPKPDFYFRNWAGNFSCVAKNYFQPEKEEEIIDVIRNGSKIRIVGSGHSWSPLCLNEDTLLNLDRFNKVLQFDKENLKLKVQGGIKLHGINRFLDTQGCAMINLGSVSEQSLAGAISTGTHGSGVQYSILASQVEEFSLIKPNGEKQIINSKRDKELFELSIINLGALGVISEITLNVVPAFRLCENSYVARLDDIIENIDRLIKETDHFKIWWFPHIEEAIVFNYTHTEKPVKDSKFRQWFMDKFISVNVYRALLKTGNFRRDWRKNINDFLVNRLITPLNRTEKSFKVFNVPNPPLHRETEWAFDLSIAGDCLREFKNMINSSGHRINFLQEIRFSRHDNFALSPCYARDTMWIGCYNADNYGWKELLSDFEHFARDRNGRPHWGKEFSTESNYLRKHIAGFDRFNQLRKQLDPAEKFSNKLISEIFE